MSDEGRSGFWERVEPGHTTACIGQGGRVPATPRGAWVVRVRCDVPHRPLGPVLDAADRVAGLVGGASLGNAAAVLLKRGLRRRLLGEEASADREASLLADLDRLADAGEGATALIFEAVDAADPATLDLLLRLVRRPLRPALVLGFRTEPSRGAARTLLDAVVASEGEARLIRAVAPSAEPPHSLDLHTLPPAALRVLRAAVVVGEGFEVDLVARLLGLRPIEVLERFQEAVDAGLPLDDLGDGRFRLDSTTAEELRAGLLPSLSGAWHRALAGLLSGDPEQPRPADDADSHGTDPHGAQRVAAHPVEESDAPPPLFGDDAPPPVPVHGPSGTDLAGAFSALVEEPPPAADPFAELARPEVAADPAPPAARSTRVEPPPLEDEADPFARLAPAETQQAAPAAPAPAPARPAAQKPPPTADPFAALGLGAAPSGPARDPRSAPSIVWTAPGEEDRDRTAPPARAERPKKAEPTAPQPGRAAHHLAAAGEAEAAIPRFLEAARQALSQGAGASAESYLNKALALTRMLPDTEARRGLRAQAHLELARLHADGSSGPHGSAGLSLGDALAEAEEALRLAGETAPPGLRAEILTVIASICYDIGDEASLNRALESLVTASHLRMAAKDARGAARLLNDQAAVWVRLGDPVRAAHLLGESRNVFSSFSERNPEDAAELAETDHLLARLPLHVGARPGMEAAAVEAALNHARSAAEVYHSLGLRRDLGRVWETVGRLEQRRGALPRARESFSRAFATGRAEGDVIGMARAAGGLAEVVTAEGRPGEALPMLAESIRLNLAKGSRLGIASNRAALIALVAGLPEAARGAPALAELNAMLRMAESRLGVGG